MLNSLVFAVLWFLPADDIQSRTLRLDSGRSTISFSVTHMGFLSVDGSFSAFEGSLHFSNNEPVRVEGYIDVRSIDTGEAARDRSLVDEGYLDAARFPRISFSSTEIQTGQPGHTITGELNIKDERRLLTIPCSIDISEEGFVTLNAEIAISRSAFNLTFGAMDALIGDEITARVTLVFQ